MRLEEAKEGKKYRLLTLIERDGFYNRNEDFVGKVFTHSKDGCIFDEILKGFYNPIYFLYDTKIEELKNTTMEKPNHILASEIQDILEGKEIPITSRHLAYMDSLISSNRETSTKFASDVRRGDKEMTAWLSQKFNEATA